MSSLSSLSRSGRAKLVGSHHPPRGRRPRGLRHLVVLLTLALLSALVGVVGTPGQASAAPAAPFRALDTRGGSIPGAGSTQCVQVTGRGGVPSNAAAVAINVTIAQPASAGFVTAYPNGASRPATSNLNYTTAVPAIAGNATVKVGTSGRVCLYTSASTHLILDVTGWFTSSQFLGGTAFRAYDSRTTGVRPAAGTSRCMTVAGRGDVPASALAVAVTIAAVTPSGAGYLTAYPQGQSVPGTSNVNYAAGDVISNGGVVKVGAGGGICVYTSSASDILVDVTGAFGASTGIGSLVIPRRVDDSRSGAPVAAGGTRCVSVLSAAPASATAVFANLSVISPAAAGYATLYASGTARPLTSSINFRAGDVRANGAMTAVGADGKVCVFSSAVTHVLLDVVGYDTTGSRVQLSPAQVAIDFGLTQLHSKIGSVYVGACGGTSARHGYPVASDTWHGQPCGTQRGYFQSAGRVGYDCSGFVWRMAKEAGVTMTVDNSDDMLGLPEVLPKSLAVMRPGDLLVRSGHVAMYIGTYNGVESVIESTPFQPYTEVQHNGFTYRINAPGVRVAPVSDFMSDNRFSVHRVPGL